MNIISPSFPEGLSHLRSEAEVRAKRQQLEDAMRVEGAPEPMIERLATDDTAARMLDYDRQVVGLITSLFGART
jgi:hypothetical protein